MFVWGQKLVLVYVPRCGVGQLWVPNGTANTIEIEPWVKESEPASLNADRPHRGGVKAIVTVRS